MRAFVVIVGTLLPFSDRARKRMLDFVGDSITDPHSPVSVRIESNGDRHAVTGQVPRRVARGVTR
jgi:hypothetical protein